MKYLKTISLVLIFFTSHGHTFDLSKLVNRKWKTSSYEQNGIHYTTTNKKIIENDYTLFLSDSTVKSIYNNDTLPLMRWSYNAALNTITTYDIDSSGFILVEKLITLNDTTLALESKFDGFTTILHMRIIDK